MAKMNWNKNRYKKSPPPEVREDSYDRAFKQMARKLQDMNFQRKAEAKK
jgi:hypothetical protein